MQIKFTQSKIYVSLFRLSLEVLQLLQNVCEVVL